MLVRCQSISLLFLYANHLIIMLVSLSTAVSDEEEKSTNTGKFHIVFDYLLKSTIAFSLGFNIDRVFPCKLVKRVTLGFSMDIY